MTMIWTETDRYLRVGFDSEADLEEAIVQVQLDLFGPDRIYLPVKRKIGRKGGQRNIPDGYLLDLTGHRPRLFVVENELAAHDPLRHIAVQLLQFSLSFEAEGRGVKSILNEAIRANNSLRARCESYADAHQFRNLDHMLEYLVFDAPFAALVIIDELPEDLERVLIERFKFGVEVIELMRYQNSSDMRMYRFEPFLAGLTEDLPTGAESSSMDTVVVPARSDGMQDVFLGEDRWYAVRIHGSMRPQIQYVAAYQVAPESAITHIAPVRSIEPWKDTGKVVINFAEPAAAIEPVKWVRGGRVSALQNLRYTTREQLLAAKTLDDVWD